MARLRNDFLWRMLQVYLKEASIFILFLLSIKILAPESFGLYSYITSFVYFFVLIGDFGISATVAKLVAEKEGDEEGLGALFVSGIAAVLALSAASLVSAFVIGSFFLDEHLGLLLYVAPVIVLAPITAFFDGYYRGQRRFKSLSLVSLFAFVVFVAASAALVLTHGLIGALLAQNVLYAALVIGMLFMHRRTIFHFKPEVMRELAQYSLIVGFGSIGYFLFAKIDVVILGKLGYLVEAGYYELATKIFSIAIITFSVFGQILAPHLIKIRDDAVLLRRTISRYRIYVVGLGVLTACIFAVSVPFLVHIFLPAYYKPVFLTGFFILAAALPFDLWAVVQRQGILVPLGMARIVTITTLVGGILNVISDIVLATTIGVIGVFISTFIIHAGVLIWQDLYLRRKLRAA